MSDTPAISAVPAVATASAAAPAPKLNAIQLIEQELVGFFKQREQAIANVHAVDGAIQGAQRLLGILKAEAAKAEAEVVKLAGEAETEAKKLVGEAAAKVISIAEAVEKKV